MNAITEDEIELEEIDSDEIVDKYDSDEYDEKGSVRLCSLCKVDIPTSQIMDHLQRDHQIQSNSALESLLNLGIINKTANMNSNITITESNSGTQVPNVFIECGDDMIAKMKDKCEIEKEKHLYKKMESHFNASEMLSSGASSPLQVPKEMSGATIEIEGRSNADVLNVDLATQLSDLPKDFYAHSATPNKVVDSSLDTPGLISKNQPNLSHKPYELSKDDRKICDDLRIVPETFLAIRATMVKECEKQNGIKACDIRKLLKMDVNKTTKLYYHFLQENVIYKPIGYVPRNERVKHKKSNIVKMKGKGSNELSSNSLNSPAKDPVLNLHPTSTNGTNKSKSVYSVGQLVLSHMKGYPWWPSMITACPLSNEAYENNGRYFVSFLDGKKNDTAWLNADEVKNFEGYEDYLRRKKKGTRPALLARMRRANRCAQEIMKWTNQQRIEYFVENNHSTEDLFHTLTLPSKRSDPTVNADTSNIVPVSIGIDIPTTNIRQKKSHRKKRKPFVNKSLRRKKKTYNEELKKGDVIVDYKRFSQLHLPSQIQNDKDAISIEEDNDIALIVNELVNELYS